MKKIEVVTRPEKLVGLKEVADITATIGTGKNGDGKIFVTDVLEAVRVRTNERNSDAIG